MLVSWIAFLQLKCFCAAWHAGVKKIKKVRMAQQSSLAILFNVVNLIFSAHPAFDTHKRQDWQTFEKASSPRSWPGRPLLIKLHWPLSYPMYQSLAMAIVRHSKQWSRDPLCKPPNPQSLVHHPKEKSNTSTVFHTPLL